MSNFVWTPEIDAELLRLKGEKKTAKEIAYALGTNEKSVGNRLYWLKKKTESPSAVASNEGTAVKSGELSELELVMAETIRELTAERDNIAERLAVYEKDYGGLLQKNEKCLEQIAEDQQQIEQLRQELKDTQIALARTEEQLDEAHAEAAAHLSKVSEQIKMISSLEKRVSELERELEGANEDIITMQDTIALRNEDVDELTGRLERAAEKAGQLLTQVLMMGE